MGRIVDRTRRPFVEEEISPFGGFELLALIDPPKDIPHDGELLPFSLAVGTRLREGA
jgi:hypothetical protein